jgi:hypothetical protein
MKITFSGVTASGEPCDKKVVRDIPEGSAIVEKAFSAAYPSLDHRNYSFAVNGVAVAQFAELRGGEHVEVFRRPLRDTLSTRELAVLSLYSQMKAAKGDDLKVCQLLARVKDELL